LSKVCVSYSYVKSICVSVLRFYDTQVRLCIAGDTQNRSLRLISSFMPSMVLMRRRSLLLRRRSRRWSRGVSEQPGNPERLLGFEQRRQSAKTSGKILEACRERPSITISELAELIGVTERSIQRNIQKLQAGNHGGLRRNSPYLARDAGL
jgi:hypothetical protein